MLEIVNRFKEPSSWAGIAALFTAVGLHVPTDIVQAITLGGALVASLLAFFLREKGTKAQ